MLNRRAKGLRMSRLMSTASTPISSDPIDKAIQMLMCRTSAVEHVREVRAQRHEVAVGEVDVVRDPELKTQADGGDREHRRRHQAEAERQPEQLH